MDNIRQLEQEIEDCCNDWLSPEEPCSYMDECRYYELFRECDPFGCREGEFC